VVEMLIGELAERRHQHPHAALLRGARVGAGAGELGDRMTVATLDTDDNPRVTRAYGVMSLPTLLVFRDGEVVGSGVGSRPQSYLRQTLSAYAEP
jgi:thioredoxin 1